MQLDIDIIVPFLIIFIITLITLAIIYPSARFNRNDSENSLSNVYNPLWFISYGIIFYAWSVLCRESKSAYIVVYLFSILQLVSLLFLYYFMNKSMIYLFIFIISIICILVVSIIYVKLIVFLLLIFNILLFFYFYQTIENSTWRA
jgi:hypothetical protein